MIKLTKNILPFSDKDIKFLKEDTTIGYCSKCILSTANNSANILCGYFVFGKDRMKWTCKEVRTEAIQLNENIKQY